MHALREDEQGSDEDLSGKGELFGKRREKLTDHGEVLEQTAVVARCPASFIRFGPQVVGEAGLFLFNSNARTPAAVAATRMTTTMATHNATRNVRPGPRTPERTSLFLPSRPFSPGPLLFSLHTPLTLSRFFSSIPACPLRRHALVHGVPCASLFSLSFSLSLRLSFSRIIPTSTSGARQNCISCPGFHLRFLSAM